MVDYRFSVSSELVVVFYLKKELEKIEFYNFFRIYFCDLLLRISQKRHILKSLVYISGRFFVRLKKGAPLMNNSIYLEIFGYIGTALVVISMMMTSVTKLRIVNMSGSVVSAIYAGICGTWPVVVLNVSLFLINGFRLVKDNLLKKRITDKNDRKAVITESAAE